MTYIAKRLEGDKENGKMGKSYKRANCPKLHLLEFLEPRKPIYTASVIFLGYFECSYLFNACLVRELTSPKLLLSTFF